MFVDYLSGYIKKSKNGHYNANYESYQLESYFQPIYDREGVVFAYEGLVRVTTDQGERIPPDVFFESVYRDGSKEELVTMICVRLHLLNYTKLKAIHANKKLFLNISPTVFETQTSSVRALDLKYQMMLAIGITPEDIVYEIVEQPGKNIAQEIRGIKALRKYGSSIAVDDFGSGCTTMKRVKSLTPDIVKIDKRLVQNYTMFKNEILALIEHCRGLKMLVVAEGIESKQQLNYFKSLGVALFQGFLLARPESVAFYTQQDEPLTV